MMLFLCCLLLVASFIWPFMGGYREMKMRRDPLPLFINMDYLKDPRYFSLSFRKFFAPLLASGALGVQEIPFSKPEQVRVVSELSFAQEEKAEDLYFVKSGFSTGADVYLAKEVYALGDSVIGNRTEMRALACDGGVRLGQGANVSRWLDAEGTIKTEENCNLGTSATTGKELLLAKGCVFRRLYGFPVAVMPAYVEKELLPIPKEVFVCANMEEKELTNIDPGSKLDCSVVTLKNLTIGENSLIRGHVKTYETLTIGAGVVITGNVFAEGDIQIGAGCRIRGNVFSQSAIVVGPGSVIGESGIVKSVVGNDAVTLCDGAVVHGYVTTEGTGIVV